jgi:hypothetical protein
VLVAQDRNPSYAGGRDQEDHSSKPAQANSLQDYLEKNPSQKWAGGVAQDVSPEFKPQYSKTTTTTTKKKKNKKKQKPKHYIPTVLNLEVIQNHKCHF